MPAIRPGWRSWASGVDLTSTVRDLPGPHLSSPRLAQGWRLRDCYLDESPPTMPADPQRACVSRWRGAGGPGSVRVLISSHRMDRSESPVRPADRAAGRNTVGRRHGVERPGGDRLLDGSAAAASVVGPKVGSRPGAPRVEQTAGSRSSRTSVRRLAGHLFHFVGARCWASWPSGQGQADLFECLSGNRRPDAGEILVQGKPGDSVIARRHRRRTRPVPPIVPLRCCAALCAREHRPAMVNPPVGWGLINMAQSVARKTAINRLDIDTRADPGDAAVPWQPAEGDIARWLATGF